MRALSDVVLAMYGDAGKVRAVCREASLRSGGRERGLVMPKTFL